MTPPPAKGRPGGSSSGRGADPGGPVLESPAPVRSPSLTTLDEACRSSKRSRVSEHPGPSPSAPRTDVSLVPVRTALPASDHESHATKAGCPHRSTHLETPWFRPAKEAQDEI